MKTVVIIPAFNEERYIKATLDRLPANLVNPTVAINGSTDRTVDIARSFGCKILEQESQGKLPAIQKVLKDMGKKALQPILILDADSKPIFPTKWHDGMLELLCDSDDDETPRVLGGPAVYTERGLALGFIKTMDRIVRGFKTRSPQSLDPTNPKSMAQASQYGPNMGIYLRNGVTLDAVLSLPHYWPGEDQAIAASIISCGGIFSQPINPSMFVLSPASKSLPAASEIITSGRTEVSRLVQYSYLERAAPNSRPYIPSL
jgi:hypothetical protein